VELVFGQDIGESQISQSLQKNLPPNLNISKVEKDKSSEKSTLKISYSIQISCHIPPHKISTLMESPSIWVTRSKKNRAVQTDIRPFLRECSMENLDHHTTISLVVCMTPQGGVSPWEILTLLGVTLDDTHSLKITRTVIDLT
jgi:hypothetical protein